MPHAALPSIELFSGAGGLALGTHLAGFHHRALMEWNAHACATLRDNAARNSVDGVSTWPVHQADIRDRIREGFFHDLGGIDLVAGGVPCQPFSLGGKHRSHRDSRDMFPDFVDVVRTVQPRAFVAENVKGLMRATFAPYFDYIKLRLSFPDVTPQADEDWQAHHGRLQDVAASGRDLGLRYHVFAKLLNAADYGVAQTRERVFIVGFRADQGITWQFPEATHSKLALLHDQWVDGSYWARHGMAAPSVDRRPVNASTLRALQAQPPTTQPWTTVRDVLADMPEPRLDGGGPFLNHVLRPGARAYKGHTGSPMDLPSKTLKAGVHGVPGGENMLRRLDGSVRYFSVREAARIQSFPDAWALQGAWGEAMRQLGNAVPMQLARVVATGVARALAPSR